MSAAYPPLIIDPAHPVVDVHWLATRLGAPGLVVLDASIPPHGPQPVRIPTARRFDLEGPLSDQSAALPHTMISPGQFQTQARRLGAREGGAVVVYDTAQLFSAPRAWWMFVAMGYEQVAVLDGGLAGWTATGRELSAWDPDDATRDAGGDLVARPRDGLIVDADRVAEALAGGEATVIDARSAARFAGATGEPRPGMRSGHMPGARHLFFGDVQAEGRMRPAGELRDLIDAAADGRDRLVFSCGSGLTACVDALAARLAGYAHIAVYDGSWSQWGAAGSGRPVVTG
ncbi:MAG: sulfurtransferase [Dermatophilaceae bacterium]